MTSGHIVRRIACLQPSATVILHALGELERVVACTKYCADVVPAAGNGSRTVLSDSWTADAKQIMDVRPDLVIASVPYQEKAVSEILKAGSRFLGFAPRTLSDIYTDIATIGGVVDAMAKAEDVIRSMQQHIEQVRQRTASSPKLKVFCEEWGKPVIASQSWVAELVEAAGGTFMGETGRTLSSDQVAGLDPDVFIASWCGAGDRVPLERIVAERGWLQTRAVRCARVFCINDELLNTPAPSLLFGLDALAHAIHPELFPRPSGMRQINDCAANGTLNPSC